MIALLIYRILLLLFLPLILLLLLVRSNSSPQYRQRLSERLGLFPINCQNEGNCTNGIVIHAASVGEVIALTPLVEKILLQFPHLPVTITTFTPTGSAQVSKQFGARVQHAYLPLDILPCTALFLNRLQPKIVVFMETELWPNLIKQCADRKIKLLLINGRLSANSMKSYQKISALISPTLQRFDKILCQSPDNLTNFLQLGARNEQCQMSGNLKFDISITDSTQEKKTKLAKFLPKSRKIWLVASTHQGDDELALAAYKIIKTSYPQLLMIIVPRHPERFNSVAKLCHNNGYSVAKRSEQTPVVEHDIWLLDTLGELMAAFALADIVTMGGSFSQIGGHNPLEPALFKKPIIVGHDMSNFADILAQLKQQQGIVQLPKPLTEDNSDELAQAVLHLLENNSAANLLGNQAHQVVLNNQGASDRTLAQIRELVT